jgi:two-component system chemotaxis response regulator CheY
MKVLIVEDDPNVAHLFKTYLAQYGDCMIVSDGIQAIQAFEKGLSDRSPYDLVCLDILMPNMNGREALKKIRVIEARYGICGLERVKVVMTTALKDSKNVVGSFFDQCEAYLIKPIERKDFEKTLNNLGLIS